MAMSRQCVPRLGEGMWGGGSVGGSPAFALSYPITPALIDARFMSNPMHRVGAMGKIWSGEPDQVDASIGMGMGMGMGRLLSRGC